jgi:hypothetical protein
MICAVLFHVTKLDLLGSNFWGSRGYVLGMWRESGELGVGQ